MLGEEFLAWEPKHALRELLDCWAESDLRVWRFEECIQDFRVKQERHAFATQAQREDISKLSTWRRGGGRSHQANENVP